MRIAQLAPPWIRVPPDSYGGIEWVVALLCDQLVDRGHDVTLFASGDSHTKAALRSVHKSARTESLGTTLPDSLHVATALRSAGEFDIVHDHSGFLAVAFSWAVDTPILHTLHGPFEGHMREFYAAFSRDCFYSAISHYQRSCMPELNYVDTVHNAVDVEAYPFREDKEDFAVLISRITPSKGTHLACEVARRAGIRLVLAGKIDPGADSEYFESTIVPFLDGDQIKYVGEVGEEAKRDLMARARCFLFPIQWAEPFGLVMAEAMAAGTPVIAIKNGAVPEVVADGITGYVVADIDEMIERLDDLDKIDPHTCREHVKEHFTPERMAAGYERNYEMILKRTGRTATKAARSSAVAKGALIDVSFPGSEPQIAAATTGRAGRHDSRHHRHRRHDLPDSAEAE